MARRELKINVKSCDIVKFKDNEVFVDAGACGLEISELLLSKCKTVKKVYAFEPDAVNIKKCEKKKIDKAWNFVEIIPCAAYSENKSLQFCSVDTGWESHIAFESELETQTVTACTIDDVIPADEIVTFIKMDIEGAELDALKGAARIIKQHRPKLSICLYHKPEDMTELPLYILSLVSDYKLFVRHYSNEPGETVLYAVVDERRDG